MIRRKFYFEMENRQQRASSMNRIVYTTWWSNDKHDTIAGEQKFDKAESLLVKQGYGKYNWIVYTTDFGKW